jgi:hypothetical protein
MTWFKVDDSFHSHPKVLAADADALGLWVVAGAWSSANLTDGFVPEHVLTRLLPDAADLARKLVSTGLWKRARGGHQFHDWTDFQPSASDVRTMREKRAAAGRVGGLNSGKARSKPRSTNEALASQIVEPPTRPVPKGRGGTGDLLGDRSVARATEGPPEPRCERHRNGDSSEPCGACGDARRARTRWDMADSERRRSAPQCRRHRGQPADTCGPCRSELLAGEDL